MSTEQTDSTFRKGRMTHTYFNSMYPAREDDCEVRIDENGAIEVVYQVRGIEQGKRVRYSGRGGSGHWHLKARDSSSEGGVIGGGQATLHGNVSRPGDIYPEWLEGWWLEGNDSQGMWRIQILPP